MLVQVKRDERNTPKFMKFETFYDVTGGTGRGTPRLVGDESCGKKREKSGKIMPGHWTVLLEKVVCDKGFEKRSKRGGIGVIWLVVNKKMSVKNGLHFSMTRVTIESLASGRQRRPIETNTARISVTPGDTAVSCVFLIINFCLLPIVSNGWA